MFYFQLGANCLWFSILDSTVFAYLLCKYLLLVIWNTRIRLCSRQNNGIVNFPVIWGDFGRRRLADDDVLSESDGDRDFYSCFPHPFPDGGRRCLLPIFLRTLSLSLSLHRQPPVSSNRKRKRAERSYAWLHNRRGRLRRQRRSDSAATYAEPTGLSTAWQPTPTQSAVVDVRWMITAAISVRQHDG